MTTSNRIIFADLSTYTPAKSISFYENVFGWKYYQDSGYFLAYKNDREVVGLYETPEKFKQMRMPHFWMTYIEVDNVVQTVEKAKALGGIIEMVQEDESFGSVALIRDPQGAGFTIYAGDKIRNVRTKNIVETLTWNELQVSDADNIIPFYSELFEWKFKKVQDDHFTIHTRNDEYIADARQIQNEYKGKYEYWVCTFTVEDVQKTSDQIVQLGGSVVSDEGNRIMCTDHSGQAFFYIVEQN